MARDKLAAVSLKSLPPGKHMDGGGLTFVRRANGSAAWVWRFTLHGRRREMGLGAFPAVSLKEARDLRDDAARLVRQGVDPIQKREADAREAVRNLHRLADVAKACFEAKRATLKDALGSDDWLHPVRLHILPKLGAVPVAQLDGNTIRDTLAPIWATKPNVARKVANRLQTIMRYAAAQGLPADLQAVANASALLGKQSHQVQHIPAMNWQDVPAFYGALGDSVTDLALRLLILTGSRSMPARLAAPAEFDLDAQVWTIPAAHMKGRKGATSDFRIPLSDEAVRVVREALRHGSDVLLPGRSGKPLSRMTLTKAMARMGTDARPHGFRSAFRSWAEDAGHPFEVAETALSHAIGNRVERSYQRSDLLDRRRVLMDRWAHHVTGQAGQVIELRG